MNKKYLIITILLAILAVILSLSIDIWQKFVPQCVFHKVTGFYCPGCGGTRAVIAMLKFDFITAFRYNPGVVSLCVIILLALIGKIINKKILPNKTMFWVVFVIILFSYYIMRNFTSFLSAL